MAKYRIVKQNDGRFRLDRWIPIGFWTDITTADNEQTLRDKVSEWNKKK